MPRKHARKTCSKHAAKTCSQNMLKTCCENMLKTCSQNMLKTCSENMLKTCSENMLRKHAENMLRKNMLRARGAGKHAPKTAIFACVVGSDVLPSGGGGGGRWWKGKDLTRTCTAHAGAGRAYEKHAPENMLGGQNIMRRQKHAENMLGKTCSVGKMWKTCSGRHTRPARRKKNMLQKHARRAGIKKTCSEKHAPPARRAKT